MENIKKLLVMMAIATLILSMTIATVSATSQAKNEKIDTGLVKVESKEKATKYKITWNGNGGKIGAKKTVSTTVKKGSKIGKLVTPKRSGYTLKGWYTKKTGGTKISANTKPKKSTTLYAQWTKKLNAEEKKLVGLWKDSFFMGRITYEFRKDGTYGRTSTIWNAMTDRFDSKSISYGYYSFKNGVLTTQSRSKYTNIEHLTNWDPIPWSNWSTNKEDITFSSYQGKQYFKFTGRSISYVKV